MSLTKDDLAKDFHRDYLSIRGVGLDHHGPRLTDEMQVKECCNDSKCQC